MVFCALVALSKRFSRKELSQALSNLKEFKVIKFFDSNSYFGEWAGDPLSRLNQVHKAFLSNVDYIQAIRGGSGVLHFLSKVNFSLLKRRPKFFVGFSDLTPLLNNIYERTRIIALHGPNAVRKLDFKSKSCLKNALQAKNYSLSFDRIINSPKKEVSGIIKGGNLAMCAWSLGSSFEIDLKDKIVFFEDVGTNEYKAFNRLIQLKNSRKFKPKVLIFGYMDNVKEKIFIKMLRELFPSIPLVFGVKVGHNLPNYTIPIGAKCKIDFRNKKIKFIFPKFAKKYAVNFD